MVGKCRYCNSQLNHSFCDLGMSPLSNAFISREDLQVMEPFFPLHAYVCDKCFLVQLEEFEKPENIFNDYVYFSSYSESWLKHARVYTNSIIERFGFNSNNLVIEIASNDGYLLKNFVQKRIKVIGIEPAENVARVAEKSGIKTIVKFFGVETATKLYQEGIKPDLLIGNNVLAHVPDINDFVEGMKILLNKDGIITMEFPHLLKLMDQNQFDTIYHEHYSYLSFLTVESIFNHHGLKIFDVQELTTHGGSLRIYACHENNQLDLINENINKVREDENNAGLNNICTYLKFQDAVKNIKWDLLTFLIEEKNKDKKIVAYGAAAKGNTLLNYCGIRDDFIEYTVDKSPHKQNKLLPGTHIPVYPVEKIRETKPDYLFILPWNIKDEIIEQMSYVREWGSKFIISIPKLEIIS